MHKIYLFSYKGDNWHEVFEVLKPQVSWYRFDQSSLIMCTNKNVEDLNTIIGSAVDPNKDRYFFLHIEIKLYEGRLPSHVWEWIKKQINKTNNNKLL